VLVINDAYGFKTIADEVGVQHQVCKAHVLCNTETLIERYQPLVVRDADGSLKAIGVSPQQAAADLARLGELVEGEQKPGFPRVKPRNQFFTLCYPAMYLDKIEGNTIVLPTGGKGHHKRYPNIIAHLTETPPEHFREVAVTRDARGNYYCSFVYDDAEQNVNDKGHNPRKRGIKRTMRDDGMVAFDLGIKTLATGVNDQGRFYHIGGFK